MSAFGALRMYDGKMTVTSGQLASTNLPKAKAMLRLMFFSFEKAPTAPASCPPCPASMTSLKRLAASGADTAGRARSSTPTAIRIRLTDFFIINSVPLPAKVRVFSDKTPSETTVFVSAITL